MNGFSPNPEFFLFQWLEYVKIVLQSILLILSLRNVFGVKRKSLPFSDLPRFEETTVLV